MNDSKRDASLVRLDCERTRIRFRVVGMGVLLAMVTYLDRACISVLAPDIMRDLSLTKMQMGFVFSAFALAYAIFEIPTAWWADRLGTRKVLTRIVVWWSTFTVATSAAWNLLSLLVTRFLFGAGEAGAWPSATRTFSRWIPCRERGTVQGIFFSGAYLAGGLTPLLVIYLRQWLGWREIFVLFGLVGFVWAVAWYRWFRDDPSEHPAVNAAELAHIVQGRRLEAGHSVGWSYWRQLLTSRNMLVLCLMYFPNSYTFYFCMTWLPTYLKEKHGLTEVSLGICAGLPMALSIVSVLLGGVATDWAVRRFGLRIGRCGLGCITYVIAAASVIVAALCDDPVAAAILIAMAVAVGNASVPAAWGTCIDIGGNHTGVVSAAMNTSGQIGSLISPVLTIAMASAFDDWNAPLYLIGILLVAGAVCWCFVDPRIQVFE